MSEPVTNAEIEDVLTAVRRLVSQSGGAKPKPRENGAAKLVLTPAFRVDADPEDPVPEASRDSVATEPSPEASPEPAVMGAEAAVPGDSPEDTPEAARDAQDVVQDVAATLRAAAQDDSAEAHDSAEQGEPSPRSALEARIAELESVVVKAPDAAYEPEGGEPEETQGEVVFHHKAEPRLRAVEPPEMRDGGHDVEETLDVRTVEVEDETPETDAENAALDDWQDVEADSFAFRPAEDFEQEDALDEGVTLEDAAFRRAEPEDHEDDFVAGAEVDAEEDDAFVIDEDMLREIVARLVREELQGTMGERITRNLRRMVRREIARALALKEFE